MPRDRTLPPDGMSSDKRYWSTLFDTTERVVVYWPEGPNSVTIVSYYDTVSEANTAATNAIRANGQKPQVAVNWWHSTITNYGIGSQSYIDGREDLPSWVDAIAGAS